MKMEKQIKVDMKAKSIITAYISDKCLETIKDKKITKEI